MHTGHHNVDGILVWNEHSCCQVGGKIWKLTRIRLCQVISRVEWQTKRKRKAKLTPVLLFRISALSTRVFGHPDPHAFEIGIPPYQDPVERQGDEEKGQWKAYRRAEVHEAGAHRAQIYRILTARRAARIDQDFRTMMCLPRLAKSLGAVRCTAFTDAKSTVAWAFGPLLRKLG